MEGAQCVASKTIPSFRSLHLFCSLWHFVLLARVDLTELGKKGPNQFNLQKKEIMAVIWTFRQQSLAFSMVAGITENIRIS